MPIGLLLMHRLLLLIRWRRRMTVCAIALWGRRRNSTIAWCLRVWIHLCLMRKCRSRRRTVTPGLLVLMRGDGRSAPGLILLLRWHCHSWRPLLRHGACRLLGKLG